MKTSRMFLLLTVCALIFPTTVLAAIHYVSPTGKDSFAGTISTPWATPQKAFYSALAGDTVYFRNGAYDASAQNYEGTTAPSAKNAEHPGTSAQPIIFAAYPGETPVISLGNNPIYIEYSYYIIDGLTFTSSGSAIFYGYDLAPVNLTVKNCTFAMTAGGDNAAGVVVYGSGASILNNTFHGPYPTQTVYATSVIAFRAQDLVVKNNNIDHFVNGIYFKHSNTCANTGNEFAYNYITNCGTGIRSVANYSYFHDNIIAGCSSGIIEGDDAGAGDCGVGGDYDIWRHNTVIGNLFKDYQDPSDYNTIKDNIFTQTNIYGSSVVYSDYNLYPTGNVVNAYSLSAWRTFLGGCPDSNSDCNSIGGSPIFTGGAIPSTIPGFALTSNSLGHSAASDGKDVGADIDSVGVKFVHLSAIHGPVKNNQTSVSWSGALPHCSIILANRRTALISGEKAFDIRGQRMRISQVRPDGIFISVEP